MWAFWLYLLLPLLNIVLWFLGIRYFYMEVLEKAGYRQLLGLLGKMGWAFIIVFAILRSWGYYNSRRFGKKDRRKDVSSATAERLSEFSHLSPEQIVTLQTTKEVIWPPQQDTDDDVSVWLAKVKK